MFSTVFQGEALAMYKDIIEQEMNMAVIDYGDVVSSFNTLRQRSNWRHLCRQHFKCTFLNKNNKNCQLKFKEFKANAFKIVVGKMLSISCWPQCVNQFSVYFSSKNIMWLYPIRPSVWSQAEICGGRPICRLIFPFVLFTISLPRIFNGIQSTS